VNFGAGLSCTIGFLLMLGGVMSIADAEAQSGRPRARLPLQVLADTLAICRLPADARVPVWATYTRRFLTISRTVEELSITALQSAVPVGVRCERDYRALRVKGQLPPDLVGILLSMAEPLARAGLSIFAISTYDTDYVLVKQRDLPAAITALRGAGHEIAP
jgi:hypothetical protein